jgi:TetR/AcrR family transcriptional regulator, transcriptional repressor for nem operon
VSTATTAKNAPPGTAARILDLAEQLVQLHGFNGFSYADIAAELDIRKASVHHHFATKATLGGRLIERYRERFAAALADIERDSDGAGDALDRYTRLYAAALRDNRMCLCGMLAAEITALPRPLRNALRRFFDENEAWLARVLERGRRAGELTFAGSAPAQARLVLAALEGAMLVARSYGDPDRFDASAALLLAGLGAERRRRQSRARRAARH